MANQWIAHAPSAYGFPLLIKDLLESPEVKVTRELELDRQLVPHAALHVIVAPLREHLLFRIGAPKPRQPGDRFQAMHAMV